MTNVEEVLGILNEQLPPFFPRKDVCKLTYGLVNAKTMANRDSLGTGPGGRFYQGKVVWYTKTGFIEFIAQLLSEDKK